MNTNGDTLQETVTLSQAKALLKCLAHEQSLLLLSAPGMGKSDIVKQAAQEANLACRSLLGTQIAPEDVSGIPRIVGERSVFSPPRILLPEAPEPFCLFLDELPACTPDIQKAFYALLLERRIGEHQLPKGTWVVAAGNRAEDQALVRTISSALVNRVTILHIRIDVREWLIWAKANGVRSEIIAFIAFMPEALMRPVPRAPAPFSTPRAWAALSAALDLVEAAGLANVEIRRALAFGRLSPEDAAVFCAMAEHQIRDLLPVREYVLNTDKIPKENAARWFVLNRIRTAAQRGDLKDIPAEVIDRMLRSLPEEHRFALLVDMVEIWAGLGASQAMFAALADVTGLPDFTDFTDL
jgi:MoxR-like ATPase